MRATSWRPLLSIAALFLVQSACVERADPTDPNTSKTAGVSSVAVQLPVASLEVGRTTSAIATQLNAAGVAMASMPVKWLSSDNAVLAVNSDGQVQARKIGTAWVYATVDGVAGRTALEVTDSVPSVLRVSPRSLSAPVGTQIQLSASIATATGRALPGLAPTWTSTDPRYASVSGTGMVTAVSAGSVKIVASVANLADTATINISASAPPPPVTNDGTSHEPSSMTPLQNWDGHSLGAWISVGTPTEKFVWDASLQKTVMEMQYDPTVVSPRNTYGPGHLYYPIRAASPLHSVYMRAQIKLSSNWVQNPSNVLKLFEIFSGRTWAIPGIYGKGSDLRLMVANDEREDPNYPGCFIGQTAPGCKVTARPPNIFTLNEWHTIEVLLVSNTPGVSNGRVKTWLDGRPQSDVFDVMWAKRGTSNAFTQLDLNPLWGGLGGTIPAAQWLSVGEVQLSGAAGYLNGAVP